MSEKLIREGRFGAPKTFKTGSVVGTYPRPLLVFNCDEEGYSIFPSRTEKVRPDHLPFEVFSEDIKVVKSDELAAMCKLPPASLPPVTVLEVVDLVKQRLMSETYHPIANSGPLNDFVKAVNLLVQAGCPWRTVVVDSVTGLNEIILSHVAAVNNAALADARKWAPMAGSKVQQCIGVLTSLPAHVVCIFHESYKENELTQETRVAPLVYSQVRDRIGGLFSQWFYQFKQNGQPKVRTTDFALIKGVGVRWPSGLPDVVGPTFKDIYGATLNENTNRPA